MTNYVDKIGIKVDNPSDPLVPEYDYRDIGIDSDHVVMGTYSVLTENDSLTKKIHDLEEATPDVATASTAGIVKPGAGLQMHAGSTDGTLDLAYDHTLTFTDENGTTIETFDGSTDKTVSISNIPTNHASANNTYGVGDSLKYGHLKITDTYQTAPAAPAGIAASAKGVNDMYTELKQGVGIELTQAQYDALTPEQQANGDYYITDGLDPVYDNSLDDLTDVEITSLVKNGDGLAYNSATQKWEKSDDVWKTMAQNGAHNLCLREGLKLKPEYSQGLGVDYFTTSAQDVVSFTAKIDQNTDYIVSHKNGNRFRVALSVDYPKFGGACYTLYNDNDAKSYEFNSSTYNYVTVFCNNPYADYDTVQPMVKLKTDHCDEWTDYAPTNRDLAYVRDGWKKNGAYNILPNNKVTETVSGNVFTVNSNKSVTVTVPTNPTTTNFYLLGTNATSKITLPAGTYKLVGCPSGGSGSKYYIQGFGDHDYTTGIAILDTGDGFIFTLTQENNLYFFISIRNTFTSGGTVTFKPMITTDLNATYDDYVPYAKTNRELTTIVNDFEVDAIPASTYFGSITFSKRSGILMGTSRAIKVLTTVSSNSYIQLGTLPASLRPKWDTDFPVFNRTTGTFGEIHITPEGVVSFLKTPNGVFNKDDYVSICGNACMAATV